MSKKTEKVILGEISVDSGQVIIVDPCYLDAWEKTKEGKGQFGGGHYEKCCNLNCKGHGGQLFVSGFGTGVASKSGYGDGVYPVEAIIKNGRVKELRIKF